MPRVSAAECYNNKDVITQIYGLMQEMDAGTIKDFQASKDATTGVITIAITLNDDTVKSYTIPSVDGVTLDTDQTVSGVKVFSADQGNQFTGDLDVGGDFSVLGDTTLGDQMEVAGASLERSGSDLIISPASRMIVKTNGGQDQEMVISSSGVIVNSLQQSTSPGASAAGTAVVDKTYVSKTDGTNNLVHTNANETVEGFKRFSSAIVNPPNSKASNAYREVFRFANSGSSGSVALIVHARGNLALTRVNFTMASSAVTGLTAETVKTGSGSMSTSVCVWSDSSYVYIGLHYTSSNVFNAVTFLGGWAGTGNAIVPIFDNTMGSATVGSDVQEVAL